MRFGLLTCHVLANLYICHRIREKILNDKAFSAVLSRILTGSDSDQDKA